MTNTKNTKRALLSSVLALFLCFAMLLGTTYAWFTDSVTSDGNIIKSGTLDVELYYADGKQAVDSADWATAKDVAIFDYDNWEPGYTDAKHLKVSNIGTLALQYQLAIVPDGEVSKLAEVIDVYYVEGGKQIADRTALNEADKIGSLADLIRTGIKSGVLEAGTDSIATIVFKMNENAGNEYQNLSIGDSFSIQLLATQVPSDYEEDSYGKDYDAVVKLAYTQAQAQEVLDNAVPGTTLYLMEGANYGTLYLRPSANTEVTKTIDWQGNNYGWETYSCFENLTIIGAEGSTIDAIEIEGGTYYHTEHSQDDAYPVMLSLVELKNVVIDGVTFTGKGGYDPQGHGNAINLSGNNIKVDGLSVKNCVLKDADNNARLIYKTESTTHVHTYTYGGESFTFTPSLKDITVTGTTFDGGYMGLELRETENVTITNNVFNVVDRNILLPVNTGYTYSGTITITGNVSNYAQERFVRADGTGDAVVVITGNTINNYVASDTDYIKVTNGNNVTIENNTITTATGVKSDSELTAALANGGEIVLVNDVVVNSTIAVPSGTTATLNLNGNDISYAVSNSGASAIIENRGTLTIVGEGTISFVAENPDMQEIPSYATNTITNEATLIIGEGVVVTNESDGGASYAVDNKGVFTLDGGTLIGKRCALRIAKYNQDNVKFTMNSGLVKGATPAWIQLPGSDAAVAPTIDVVINGGTFETTKATSADNNVLYTYSFGNSHANTSITINGGEFLGGTVSIGSGYKGDAPALTINGGTFEYDVLKWTTAEMSVVVYNANK